MYTCKKFYNSHWFGDMDPRHVDNCNDYEHCIHFTLGIVSESYKAEYAIITSWWIKSYLGLFMIYAIAVQWLSSNVLSCIHPLFVLIFKAAYEWAFINYKCLAPFPKSADFRGAGLRCTIDFSNIIAKRSFISQVSILSFGIIRVPMNKAAWHCVN